MDADHPARGVNIPRRNTLSIRDLTDARVALTRFGAGISTRDSQLFLLDHARAREAVWLELDREATASSLRSCGLNNILVESLAADRGTYVRRPDLGRRLSASSAQKLASLSIRADVVIVLADGLSAGAISTSSITLVKALSNILSEKGLEIAPIIIASQGRVALGDPIGAAFGAKLSIVLIGERPGLSSPVSLGAYVTYAPRPGANDAMRNCVSNIRLGGLGIEEATYEIANLCMGALRLGESGITLKPKPRQDAHVSINPRGSIKK